MLGTIVAIIAYLCEILLIILLASKIKRYKSLTIKDTVVYPLLLVFTLILLTISRLLYTDANFFNCVRASFDDALDIIKVSINNDLTSILKDNNIPLLVAYYGAFAISLLALSSLTVYCLVIAVKNFIRLLKIKFAGKEIIYILGFNGDAKKMIKSFKEGKIKMACILDKGIINKYVEEKTFLDKYKIPFIEKPYKEKEDYEKTIASLARSKNRKYTFITFFEEDKKNDEFSTAIINFLNDAKRNKGSACFIMNVNSVQQRFIQKKHYDGSGVDTLKGKLRTYNKYDLNSYLFNREHTFAKCLNLLSNKGEKFINDDCTLGDVDIHAYFIGFGKVNQPLLRDILVNNQFVKKVDSGKGYLLEPYQIQVDVYDENKKLKALDLTNGLLKYHKDCYDQKDYLELPHDYASNVNIHLDIDIEEANFINSIYDGIKERIKKDKRKQVNFFFVSLNSDMYNTLIADNLRKHLVAISKAYNFFFVRKERVTSKDIEDDYYKFIGDDKSLFSPENVLLDSTYRAAKKEHFAYSKKQGDIDELWNGLSRIKQQSNLYAVLGLSFKKDLLNGNYKGYNPNNLQPVGDDDIDRLITPKKSFDPIDVLAFSEHERWNAFEYSQGVLPMKKSLFDTLNEKAVDGKVINQTSDGNYHLCITTQKGLVDYYKLFNKKGYKGANVIGYDYDLMNEFIASEKE